MSKGSLVEVDIAGLKNLQSGWKDPSMRRDWWKSWPTGSGLQKVGKLQEKAGVAKKCQESERVDASGWVRLVSHEGVQCIPQVV